MTNNRDNEYRMRNAPHKALFCIAFMMLLQAGTALAHGGLHAAGDPPPFGLLAGLLHPLEGLDHILAMLSIGLLAANYGGHALYGLPLMALAGLAAGTTFGSNLNAPAALIEVALTGGVILLGLMVFRGRERTIGSGYGIVALLGFLHGLVHGTSLPAPAIDPHYWLGFAAGGLLLQFLGVAAGFLLQWVFPAALRTLGLLIAVVGFYFGLILFG